MIKSLNLAENTPIQYFLNDELVGETTTKECSCSIDRVLSAKKIGIDYYDSFKLRAGTKGEAFSKNCIIDGKPLNDFKQIKK
jgi:hypothetical protein